MDALDGEFDLVMEGNDLGPSLHVAALSRTDPIWMALHGLRTRLSQVIRDLKSLPATRQIVTTQYLGLTEDRSLAAFHLKSNETDFLGLGVGAVKLLFDLFYRLLAEPRVLPMLGDPLIEKAGRSAGEGLTVNHDLLVWRRPSKGKEFDASAPSDKARRHFAERLAQIGLDWVVLHELGHSWQGHTVFGKADIAVRRFLEADADSFAGYVAAMQIVEMEPDNLAAFTQRVFEWQFAIFTVFCLNAVGYGPPTCSPERHHYPPWRLRRYLTMAAAELFFIDCDRHDLLRTFRETAVYAAEQAIAAIHLLDEGKNGSAITQVVSGPIEGEDRIMLLQLASFGRTHKSDLLSQSYWSSLPNWEAYVEDTFAR